MRGRPRKTHATRHPNGRTRNLYNEIEKRDELGCRLDSLRIKLGLAVLSADEWDLLATAAAELRKPPRQPKPPRVEKQPRKYSENEMARYQRLWRAANPDLARKNQRKRSDLKKGGISERELRAWASVQDKVCRWCRAECPDKFHVDHIVPLARGGAHEAHNLCISCVKCNLSKGAKHPEEFELRLIVEREQSAA